MKKKYGEVEVTFTYSIANGLEEKSAQKIMNQNGHCQGIMCHDCPFNHIEQDGNLCGSRAEILRILEKFGFKKKRTE